MFATMLQPGSILRVAPDQSEDSQYGSPPTRRFVRIAVNLQLLPALISCCGWGNAYSNKDGMRYLWWITATSCRFCLR